jgi:EmrB/QacA subfamily drug resistance transporter
MGRRWASLGLLCCSFLMIVLGSTIVFTAAPSIAGRLGLAVNDVQWIFSASAIVSGGLLLFGGRVADLVGHRRVFLTGLALFTSASALCGAAWNSDVLIAGRVLQGIAGAMLTPAALALVMAVFPAGAERTKALAIWSTLGGIGATAGLLAGGLVVDHLGWRWVFLVNVPVGLAVLALGPLLLPSGRHPTARRELDAAGAVAITAALMLLIYAITRIPATGWLSLLTLGPLTVAAALMAVFVVTESRSAAPLLPLRILRSPTLVHGNIVLVVAGFAVDGMLLILTLYCQQVLGYTAIQFGLAVSVMTLASLGGSYGAQRAISRYDVRPVAVTGVMLIAGGCGLFARLPVNGAFLPDLFPGLLVFGLGMGAAFVSGSVASLANVTDSDSGVAAGLQNTSFTLGTALGVAVLSTVAAARSGPSTDAAALVAGYRLAFAAAAFAPLVGLLAAAVGRPARRMLVTEREMT